MVYIDCMAETSDKKFFRERILSVAEILKNRTFFEISDEDMENCMEVCEILSEFYRIINENTISSGMRAKLGALCDVMKLRDQKKNR